MRPIVGDGTPETDWQSRGALSALPELTVPLPSLPLVVAPHPDDEILGAAGLLALTGGEVVAVTDGEASHPHSVAVDPAELLRRRRAETVAALDTLGRPDTRVHRLGHRDGDIDADRLVGELVDLLGRDRGRWCVASWREDGHPDHEAVGRAAARACALTGSRLVEYPIWMWHWAHPGDETVPWSRAYRLPLDASVQAAKRAAIGRFASQIEPLGPDPADAAILPPHVRARFDRAEEVFFA